MADTLGVFIAMCNLAEVIGPRVHAGPDPNEQPEAQRLERELAMHGRFPALEDGWK